MDYQENDIASLLPRYCEGSATPEEQKQVKAFMQASEENRRIVRQMEMLYLATDTARVLQQVDPEKAFAKTRKRMHGERKSGWWKWAQRIAAGLCLPLLAAFLVEYYANRHAAIPMLEARTNPGMTGSIVLPDSTIVYLNSETSLRYPASFSRGREQTVELEGEAYFEVKKEKGRRFIVCTPRQTQIEVTGTTFNVEAYETDDHITTTLMEGKVYFVYGQNPEKQRQELSPGEKLVYDPADEEAHLYPTDGKVETSWKDGRVVFDNTPLPEALRILEKRYGVKFILKNPSLKNAFTGTFTNQRLERILEYFKLSSHIRWRYVDGKDIAQQKTHIEIY